MAFSINDIRANLEFGGARPSLFEVTITNPVTGVGMDKVPFMVRAATLPASTIGVIQVPYFGRFIKVPGVKEYSDWNVTVVNDEDFKIRNALETWSNAINTPTGNLARLGSRPSAYKSQATVTQFSKSGAVLRTYQFNGIFPANISDIQLSWENGNEIEVYEVTWAYDNYQIVGGVTGNAGGV